MFTRTIQQRHNIGCHAVYNCALYFIQIISHDEIHYREPISFSGNALKLTYGNVELKNVSVGNTPGPPLQGKERKREGVGWVLTWC